MPSYVVKVIEANVSISCNVFQVMQAILVCLIMHLECIGSSSCISSYALQVMEAILLLLVKYYK